ncbi:hypothetical protein A0H81_11115 [Grifola frondosa]|uniref:F-box domain-containing protein n=1 Tax=Grifola frondosa TaxID=5627 RepID=A0A1C7LX82_GRIFR|nr:hypothetical protein A0H81_11115 [Grifola frondosa]
MPLLPLLESLDWYHIASFPKDSLLSVISPSLRRVCIEFDGLHTQWTHELRHHDVTLLIRELCSKAPALQIVRITGSVRLPSLLPVASLQQLRQLEVLDSRSQFPIDVILPVFRSMSTLPSLVKLDIPIGAITEALRVTGFHMLESLNTSGSVSDVTHFILGITSPYFRSIQIHVKPADLEKQRNFFAALSLKFATSLRSVFAAFLHGEPGTEPPFLLEIIGPLLAVGGLQRISLDFGALNVSIPDDEIFRMAETWPDLTKLQLECGSTERRPSVHALSALARCCPQLSELVLPSLDDSPLLSEAAPDYIFVGHKLRRLQIGARHLGLPQFVNPRWLAIFIDQSFPFLNVSRCLREHHWPFRLVQHWVGVLRQIKNLRVGRRAVGLRNYETECTKEW